MESVQFQPVRRYIWDKKGSKFLDYSFGILEGFGYTANPEILMAGPIFQIINLA